MIAVIKPKIAGHEEFVVLASRNGETVGLTAETIVDLSCAGAGGTRD